MNAHNRTRVLGCYLLLCVAYQTYIHHFSKSLPSPMTVFGHSYENFSWLDFGNPRWVFAGFQLSDVLYWGSAWWLLATAVAILAKPQTRSILRAYVFVELVLASLNLIFVFLAMGLRYSLGSGYSVRTDLPLQTTAMVAFLFSVLPCSYGLWILRKRG